MLKEINILCNEWSKTYRWKKQITDSYGVLTTHRDSQRSQPAEVLNDPSDSLNLPAHHSWEMLMTIRWCTQYSWSVHIISRRCSQQFNDALTPLGQYTSSPRDVHNNATIRLHLSFCTHHLWEIFATIRITLHLHSRPRRPLWSHERHLMKSTFRTHPFKIFPPSQCFSSSKFITIHVHLHFRFASFP